MGNDLIIVESPAKVRTIKKFLGRGFDVEASVGHVRDLPKSELGVDEEQGFVPKYVVLSDKKKVVGKLKSAAGKADTVYLAPDPDREGEAIAWHVAELIRDKNQQIKRIQFNEITARAVKEALKHPRGLNQDLFNSQQARRVLDRLVGYKISPLLWKKVKRGLSAGRVQSVALRLIVDRERERQAFKPVEYWLFKALVSGQNPPPFEVALWKVGGKKPEIGSEKQAKALEQKVKGETFRVKSVEEKERAKHPVPPFTTSTLQQEASRRLRFPAKKTMRTAQRLYEGVELGEMGTQALITYMRTDSFRIASEARDAAKQFILANLGKEYYPEKPRVYRSKKSAQEAHEAIRPVEASLTPEQVKPHLPSDQYRLYKLIWERFMASQMAPARFWDTTVTAAAGDTLWRAKGERLIFPGFLKIYGYETGDEGGENNDVKPGTLPKLAEGEDLELSELTKEQKFTQPPPRYSEASLVKELEEKGIGRPSTYAAIISTLLDRSYAVLQERQFAPTELGYTVSDLLVEHFPKLLDVDFTANMEASLDKVAEGGQDWVDLLKNFTSEFNPTLEKAAKNMAMVKTGKPTGIKCDKCGKDMVIKFGKMGSFLACSGYPECKNTKDFERDSEGGIVIREQEEVQPEKVGTCPECGNDLVIKKSRTGSRFIACSGYPKCKYTEPFSTGVPCPNKGCDGELVEKSSRRGKVFYSCNRYPECDYAVWDWPVSETCDKCGHPIMTVKYSQKRGRYLACGSKKCRNFKPLDEEE